MATLKEIKKRIVSVKNTQKVTKTMKMIAAARLRKAQHEAVNARGFSLHLKRLVANIVKRNPLIQHPLLRQPAELKAIDLIVLTSDRGLCGGFNETLLRQVQKYIANHHTHGVTMYATVIGKKGNSFFKSRNIAIGESRVAFYDSLSVASVTDLVSGLLDRFANGDSDHLVVAYNQFKSAMTQEPIIEPLLPMISEVNEESMVNYIFEPNTDAVLDAVLKRSIITRFYQACLESVASELAARMTAMDNASRNASELIESLTMVYNRARQAAITTDLMDIVNGAESLKS